MATMIGEVYDALKGAGVPEDKARKAAEAMAMHEPRFSSIMADLTLLKWMVGFNLAITVAVLGKLLLVH